MVGYSFGGLLAQILAGGGFGRDQPRAVPGRAARADFLVRSALPTLRNPARGPLLIIVGAKDRFIPPAVARPAYKHQRRNGAVTEFSELPGRGHSLTIDAGWREVAETPSVSFADSSRQLVSGHADGPSPGCMLLESRRPRAANVHGSWSRSTRVVINPASTRRRRGCRTSEGRRGASPCAWTWRPCGGRSIAPWLRRRS